MSKSEHKDASLAGILRNCREGNDGAWKSFLSLFEGFLRAVILKQQSRMGVQDKKSAEDVLQEVLVELIEGDRLSGLKSEENIHAYLKAICVSKTVDFIKLNAPVFEPVLYDIPSREFRSGWTRNDDEVRKAVDEVLLGLTDDEKLIVRLCWLHGMTYKDICSLTSYSESMVGKIVRKAKEIITGYFS